MTTHSRALLALILPLALAVTMAMSWRPGPVPAPATAGAGGRPTAPAGPAQATATPSATPEPTPTEACNSYNVTLDLVGSADAVRVGELVTVTARLFNQGCGAIGLPSYFFDWQSATPDIFDRPPPLTVEHSTTVGVGGSDAASIVLRTQHPGVARFNARVSFRYRVGSAYWGRADARPLELTVTEAETATPTATPSPTPTAPCITYKVSLDLLGSASAVQVGEPITVTARLVNEGCGSIGLPSYTFDWQSDTPGIFDRTPPLTVDHSTTVGVGASDQASIVLRTQRPGRARFTARVSFRYREGSAYWGEASARPLELTVMAVPLALPWCGRGGE